MIKTRIASLTTLPVIGGLIFLLLETFFWYLHVDPLSFPVFLLGVFLIVYIPGRLLLKKLAVTITPLERFFLELGAGYVATTLAYYLSRLLNVEIVYGLLICVLAACYFYSILFQSQSPWPAFSLTPGWFSLCFVAVFLLILGAGSWLNAVSWVFYPDGGMKLATLVFRDYAFHISLVNELASFFPPQYPYAGNFALAYHYFPDLFASVFVRFGGLMPWDLVTRFLPVFHFTLLFGSVFILVRRLTANRWLSLVAVFELHFLGNMGFLAALLGRTGSNAFWEGYFTHHLTMLYMNPMQIATAIVTLGLFCLARYLEHGEKSWFALSALLLGLLSLYKVFSAIAVILGLAVPALVLAGKKRDLKLVYLLLAVVLITAATSPVIIGNIEVKKEFISFKPLYMAYFPEISRTSSAENFNLAYEKYFNLMFHNGPLSFLRYFIGTGIFFLAGCFWLRIVGLKKWLEDLISIENNPTASVLAYTILAGLMISMIFTIPPEDYNIIFFIDLSLYLMSIYAAWGFFNLLANRSDRVKTVAVIIFLALSVPTTLNLLWSKTRGGREVYVSPQVVGLGMYLRRNIPAGSMIVHPFTSPLYLLIPPLASVRSMSERVFPIENLLGRTTTVRLRLENLEIYRTKDKNRLRQLITKNKIDYIIEDQQEKVSGDKKGIMTEIYRQDGYIVNKTETSARY